MVKKCIYCEKSTPPVPLGYTAHSTCAQAFGLDYDPISEEDAARFLRRNLPRPEPTK